VVSAADVAGAAALGGVLGVVTGMPIGIVNVAIVEAATRGERRFATGIGIGGALADTVHTTIAFVGVGHVVERHPALAASSSNFETEQLRCPLSL
jgi:threonine/homoserine/homoserine lactone efflux protein